MAKRIEDMRVFQKAQGTASAVEINDAPIGAILHVVRASLTRLIVFIMAPPDEVSKQEINDVIRAFSDAAKPLNPTSGAILGACCSFIINLIDDYMKREKAAKGRS